jgi:hypothetical protein
MWLARRANGEKQVGDEGSYIYIHLLGAWGMVRRLRRKAPGYSFAVHVGQAHGFTSRRPWRLRVSSQASIPSHGLARADAMPLRVSGASQISAWATWCGQGAARSWALIAA